MRRTAATAKKQRDCNSEAKMFSRMKECQSECLDSGFLSEVMESSHFEPTPKPTHGQSSEPRTSPRLPDFGLKSVDISCEDSGLIDVISEDDDFTETAVSPSSCGTLSAVDSASPLGQSLDRDLEKLINDAFMLDDLGETALHSALVQGATEEVFSIVRLAPSSGYLNIRNGSGQSPLHVAVRCRQPLATRRLVIGGASLTSRDRSGNTALHLACTNGDLATLRCLTTPVTQRETIVCPHPRRLASESASVSSLLDTRNEEGFTCLQIAAVSGHRRIVAYLVDSLGVNIDAVDGKSGKTAAHLCAELGFWPECELLARLGADMSSTSWCGETIADCAAASGFQELARLLCAFGSDLSPEDDSDDDDDGDDDVDYDEDSLDELEGASS